MFRKLIIIAAIGLVLLFAGLPSIVAWLDRIGLIEGAASLKAEYLTGTAITVIIVMLIMLPSTYRISFSPCTDRCAVYGALLRARSRYCPACGSRVAA